jgi:3-oxoacyl-[acyl-carrier protein] reductase
MAIGFEQMHLPLGHMGSPDDVAAAVAFLSSPANNYINGTVLRVNGGLLMG